MQKQWDIDSLTADIVKRIKKQTLADKKGKLPSERKLMDHYNVSRYALRQALSKLSKNGYIYQIQGRGSYVREHHDQTNSINQSDLGFTEDLAREGKSIQTVSAFQRIVPFSEIDFSPGNQQFSDDQLFIEIERFRTLENKPYLVEHSYYLPEIVGEISEEAMYGSMFDYLSKEKGLTVGFIDKFIRCELLTESYATFFHLETNMPSLTVRDDSYLREGELVAFSKVYYDYRDATLFMHKKLLE